jgi:hypothetical protein
MREQFHAVKREYQRLATRAAIHVAGIIHVSPQLATIGIAHWIVSALVRLLAVATEIRP